MVRKRKLIWLISAQNDRKEIFKYWNDRNKSKEYSKKLNLLFKEKTEILKDFPFIGQITNVEEVRILTVKNYLIVYELSEHLIKIFRVWESHQNPENLEF